MFSRALKKYVLPGLHVNFAQKEKSPHFNDLLTGDGLRRVLEEKNYYAVDMVFPFIPSLIDKGFDFEGRC